MWKSGVNLLPLENNSGSHLGGVIRELQVFKEIPLIDPRTLR